MFFPVGSTAAGAASTAGGGVTVSSSATACSTCPRSTVLSPRPASVGVPPSLVWTRSLTRFSVKSPCRVALNVGVWVGVPVKLRLERSTKLVGPSAGNSVISAAAAAAVAAVAGAPTGVGAPVEVIASSRVDTTGAWVGAGVTAAAGVPAAGVPAPIAVARTEEAAPKFNASSKDFASALVFISVNMSRTFLFWIPLAMSASSVGRMLSYSTVASSIPRSLRCVGDKSVTSILTPSTVAYARVTGVAAA